MQHVNWTFLPLVILFAGCNQGTDTIPITESEISAAKDRAAQKLWHEKSLVPKWFCDRCDVTWMKSSTTERVEVNPFVYRTVITETAVPFILPTPTLRIFILTGICIVVVFVLGGDRSNDSDGFETCAGIFWRSVGGILILIPYFFIVAIVSSILKWGFYLLAFITCGNQGWYITGDFAAFLCCAALLLAIAIAFVYALAQSVLPSLSTNTAARAITGLLLWLVTAFKCCDVAFTLRDIFGFLTDLVRRKWN